MVVPCRAASLSGTPYHASRAAAFVRVQGMAPEESFFSLLSMEDSNMGGEDDNLEMQYILAKETVLQGRFGVHLAS